MHQVSYQEHPAFNTPSGDTVLWRYMDFARFVSLLERRALFFSAAAHLSDPFEGSYPKANVTARREMLSSTAMAPETVSQVVMNAATFARGIRKFTYISCWHTNSVESAAMWAQYATIDRGIAVRTTFERLTKSLQPSPDEPFYAGAVQYVDFESATIPDGNTFYPFMHKRLSFAYEQELRAVVLRLPIVGEEDSETIDIPQEGVPGLYIPTDLEYLIEAIYVAPQSPTWVVELIGSLLARYALTRSVTQSI